MITLRGDRMIAHQGESILWNLGLQDWIAEDAEAYVEMAAARGADVAGLAQLRAGLRGRLLASPHLRFRAFCAPSGTCVAGDVEQVLRGAMNPVSEKRMTVQARVQFFGYGFSLWGAAAFLGAFTLCALYVLHDFYHLGAMRDTYWLAGVVWRSGLELKDPAAVRFIPDGSFLRTHLSPFLYLPNALSYVFSLGPTYWYSIVYGLLHASLTLGVFYWVRKLLGISVVASMLAALLAVLFAFNGNAAVSLQLPHYEIAIPAFILLVLSLLAAEKYRMALTMLIVTLTLREDAGLHFAALLAPTLIVRRLLGQQQWALDRWAWRFAVVAICYSIAAFAVQRTLYGNNGMLVENYLGSPVFAHVTQALIDGRLSVYLHERSYIWAPFLASIAWAALMRNPLIPLGFVGGLPWLVLHFLAKVPVVGGMAWYYGFPLIVGIAWPLLAVWWWRNGAPSMRERRLAVAGFALILACTLIGQVAGRTVVYPAMLFRSVTIPGPEAAAADRFVAAVAGNQAVLGRFRVDEGVRGLAPHEFPAGRWLETPLALAEAVDTVIWFDPGGMDKQAWLMWIQQGLNFHYAIRGTHLVMASNRSLDTLAPLASLLQPTSLLNRRLQPGENSLRTLAGINTPASVHPGAFASGPRTVRATGLYVINSDLELPLGRYEISIQLRMQLPPAMQSNRPLLGVVIESPGGHNRIRAFVQRGQLSMLPGGDYVARYTFDVKAKESGARAFNIVLERYSSLEWTLLDARLTPVGQRTGGLVD